MKSKSPDFDLRLSPADLDALREADRPRALSGPDYLRLLSQFKATYEQQKAKPGPQGEPFQL